MEPSPELTQRIAELKEAAKGIPHSARFIDLSEQRFGRLKVICFAGKGYRNASKFWCLCDCGKLVEIYGSFLPRGHTTSCGCAQAEITRNRSYKHGFNQRGKRTKEYRAWASAKNRTTNPDTPGWKWYGARGTKMCAGAQNFETFLAVIGNAPSDAHSLDRKDTYGHYSCGQCEECKANGWPMNMRWTTKLEQMNNTRRNHFVSYNGKAYTLAQLSRELGLDPKRLCSYLYAGWDLESSIIKSKL